MKSMNLKRENRSHGLIGVAGERDLPKGPLDLILTGIRSDSQDVVEVVLLPSG